MSQATPPYRNRGVLTEKLLQGVRVDLLVSRDGLLKSQVQIAAR